ncbi:hypothetical protein [Flavitalea sp.]|nr:hypothetical protein [Flavitalea sp.]
MKNSFTKKNPLAFKNWLTLKNSFTLSNSFTQKNSSILKSSFTLLNSFALKNSSIIAFLAVCIFASCEDKPEPDRVAPASQTAAEDSVANENIDTVLSDETIALFNQSGFSTFAKSKSPAFDWSKFRMMNSWKEDSLYITPFEPASNFYEIYKPYLKYSPDGSMFIDLDSYNLALEKDENGRQVAIESGPDTEVSLVNVKDKKKTRLVFLGPGSSIEDGSWIDNDNLILLGFQESGDAGNKLPVIWRYHLPTTTFYIYEMPDPAVAKQLMGQWRKERLKGLTIK